MLLGVRQLGLLEPMELSAFDRMMQVRPSLPPDPRLLVVTVTEEDIRSLERWPMPDAVMNQLLQTLEQYQPAAIGLDIYRDIPVPPGNAELSERLQKSDRIIPICQLKDAENPGTPQPPRVPESRVGFSDLAVDAGGTVRRGQLFQYLPASPGCTTPYSLSFQLARRYLEEKGIKPKTIRKDQQQEYLQIGRAVFKPLSSTSGGYQKADTGGYQILLNYRSPEKLAQRVTLTEVLQNRIDPTLVKDRIVLIGVTAPSLKDTFYTPYSTEEERLRKMPGVEVHGQIVSQILSTVLDGRRLFWFWPEWGEVLWIWVWSLTGGLLVQVTRHPVQLVLIESLAVGLLLGTSVVLFFESGWIPVVAPVLGLVASGTGVLAYSAYQAQREAEIAEEIRQETEKKAREQENNIAMLQALLRERANNPPITTEEEVQTEQIQVPEDDSTAIWNAQGDSTAIWNAQGDSTAIWNGQNAEQTPSKTQNQTDNPNLLSRRYKINRVLGSGGFGLTYLAEDILRPGKPKCVVKHLRPALRDEKFLSIARRLFHTEAEILEKLGRHSQIPQLLAYFEETQEFYLVEEYIQGDALNEELPVDKRLPEAEVVELIQGILEVLMFIHEHGVIHRDIKPSNIIRRHPDGKIVLIDFGAVKEIQPQGQTDEEHHTVAVGTRGYSPAEQYAGHPIFSSDIYAVGMIGIQALTGIPPHQLPVFEETNNVDWRNLANVSEELARILDKMVRYHFPERYKSTTEVLEELNKIEV
ncbi:CHASE2 domain-containing protein [Coleofasciculus sp. LEGE 07092]|nr:CHASE2 domain-containing protein [Coleofasciculus sp. LEGE 07081]MBE9149671.1 CHASE2 domain-containing protein [Coleofasciculus sp. LEGE 07092]